MLPLISYYSVTNMNYPSPLSGSEFQASHDHMAAQSEMDGGSTHASWNNTMLSSVTPGTDPQMQSLEAASTNGIYLLT